MTVVTTTRFEFTDELSRTARSAPIIGSRPLQTPAFGARVLISAIGFVVAASAVLAFLLLDDRLKISARRHRRKERAANRARSKAEGRF